MPNEWKPIEGETPIDPSHLKDKGIKTRSQLNRAEFDNIHKATFKYLSEQPSKKNAPFEFGWLLKLHGEMFGDVWSYAGTIRQKDLNIGVPWSLVGQRLSELVLTIPVWVKSVPDLEQAVRIHHQAVQIHPFLGGNGRWSRMLANIWLKQQGLPVVEWPEGEIGTTESAARGAYIAAIKQADAGDMTPLIGIHGEYWPG